MHYSVPKTIITTSYLANTLVNNGGQLDCSNAVSEMLYLPTKLMGPRLPDIPCTTLNLGLINWAGLNPNKKNKHSVFSFHGPLYLSRLCLTVLNK